VLAVVIDVGTVEVTGLVEAGPGAEGAVADGLGSMSMKKQNLAQEFTGSTLIRPKQASQRVGALLKPPHTPPSSFRCGDKR
jgi:hypothetical protein